MKRYIAVVLFLFIFCLSGAGASSANQNRPNVVLIIIDTLRADKLGCYGFPENTSPELDKLAENGVKFKRVISQCSWTRPSIGSMLTSLYPRSTGLYKDGVAEILNDKYLTLPEILKSNGYLTFGITANPAINSTFNFNQGFDYYIDSDIVWDWMMNLGEGKKMYKPDVIPLPDSERIFKTALYKIKSIPQKPVYIQINIMEVHEGWRLIRPEFKNRFAGHEIHWYLEAVRQVSFDIDKFIKELMSMPGWENTLLVITSDHGQGLNDHPNVGNSQDHGYLLYESQLWVPLIFYHPVSGLKGKKVEQPVRLIDLMPTILDYLKIPLPDRIEGKSLFKLMTGEISKVELPKYFVAETYFQRSDKIAVYSDKWKYIENRANQEGVNRFELQPMGIKENGKLTDKINEYKKISQAMKEFLASWEKLYPKAEATRLKQEPREETIQQLKSLGYLN